MLATTNHIKRLYYAYLYFSIVSFLLLRCTTDVAADDANLVRLTYGSAISVIHVKTNYKLFSAKISWGSGSGMQAVTANDDSYDNSLLWILLEGTGEKFKPTGTYVLCGDIIRLEHNSSHKFLHSHTFVSPISKAYEVCGYGGTNPSVDSNFQVICDDEYQKYWMLNKPVRLKHVSLTGFLKAESSKVFNYENCPRCPIMGHLEVVVTKHSNKMHDQLWKAVGGVILHLDESEGVTNEEVKEYMNDEL